MSISDKLKSKLDKFSRKRVTNKVITRESKVATIDETQPVHTTDRSRFFKKTWDREERRLFFT